MWDQDAQGWTSPTESPWAPNPGAPACPSPDSGLWATQEPSETDTFDPRLDLGGWMLADSWKYPDAVTELMRRGIVP